MRKRGKIRAFTLLSAVFLTLCGLWADAGYALASSRTELEYSYRRALGDLTDHVTAMRSVLQKAPYVNTPTMQNAVSAELLEQSSGAKSAMAILPFPQEKTERISQFFSQTGSYALSLSRHAAAGRSQEESDLEILSVLEEYAETLSEALQKTQARIDTEGISLGRFKSLLRNVEAPADQPLFSDEFDEAAEAFAQFPALLYDGPFSDHIQRRTPLFLEGMPEIDEQEAARKAAEFLHCSPDELEPQGEGGSQLPVFSFSGREAHVTVTKAGGQIAYFKKAGPISEARLDYTDALTEACRMLKELGISEFRETYYVSSDNLCTINFAGAARFSGEGSDSAEEIVCYPDLVKVTIELQEGGMVEYDASGDLMNRRERELSRPALSKEQAAENLSPRLTVESAQPAVIPSPGLEELLCWEFRCTAENGREFLVYINGETGLEEQLYLLQKDDHGILAM